jgi:uncharacterized protein (TIGR03435 family)
VRPLALLKIATVAVVFTGAGACAQLLHPPGANAPSFEVATVKQAHGAAQVFSLRLQPDRFLAEDAPLDRLIRFAYDVKSDRQVVNLPAWAASESFDIDAKIGDAEVESIRRLPPDRGFEQYRLMVQSLLAERFQMRTRTENRELPVYALVVAKNGPKLTRSAARQDGEKLELPQLHFTAAGDLNAACVSMEFFAGWLSGKPDTGDRVVFDETGLEGGYDFALNWSPVWSGSTAGGAGSGQQPDASLPARTDKPPLFTAIQEQLGLKLQPARRAVEVLVIDHIERPTAN